MSNDIVVGAELGPEFDKGNIQAGFVRMKLGAGLSIQPDGTIVATAGAADFVFPLGGQFLLDPNEINGWGAIGPYDNTNSQDLGNVGAAVISRLSGGLTFPFDVRLLAIHIKHQNNNASHLPWGWLIYSQEKNINSNATTGSYLIDQVGDNGGVGPNIYGNTFNQQTNIDVSASSVILPQGNDLVLAVAAPTAITTNNYVRVTSGYIHLERL